jgi:hypothetical protein
MAAAAILDFVWNEIWNAGCESYVGVQVPKKFRVSSLNGLELIQNGYGGLWRPSWILL